jgi:signal transduction histidine kinase
VTVLPPHMESGAAAGVNQSTWSRFWHALPKGGLPMHSWRGRHNAILILLWVHVPLLVALGMFDGYDRWISNAYYSSFGTAQSLLEGGVIALFALAASWPRLSPRIRAVAASIGLVTCSAVLTQFSGGFIEAHFHFFVMLGVIAMYLDWVPFLLAIGYVAVHHGTVGTIDPTSVYNHPAAIASPWRWAFIHAFFVLGLSVAQIAHWRLSETERARTDAILASTGEAIVGIDAESVVTFANPAAIKMLGAGRDLVGRRLGDVAAIDGVESGEAGIPTEGPPRRGSGHLRIGSEATPIEWSFAPVDRHDVRLGAVVTLRDVSLQRRNEADRAQRLAAQKEVEALRRQQEFKNNFINAAAHELNTPLTPINIYLRVLGRSKGLDAKQQEALSVLDRNFKRFGRLVGDLLDAARIQSDRLAMTHAPIDLAREVLDEALASFHAAAKDAGIQLTGDIPKDLQVTGDAQRLTQVVYNLLNNALKFTPEGGRVELLARRDDGHVLVTVRDSGTGLTSQQIERLFQPFSQVHEHQQTTLSGTGLGLYLSRALVEKHGGEIWCESDGPGKGSSFHFRLPLGSPTKASA